MSGIDAAGGFAYQHAQAIQLALELAQDENVGRIRVEADNDVIDVEVWSTTGELIKAFQFKRRNEAYTWGQQELIDELTTWSGVGQQHSRATYHFVTDGRLGPTGRNVQLALANAANGDLAAIKLLLEEKAKSAVDVDTMRRAKIVVDEASYGELIEKAEQKAKALLPNVISAAEAEERGRWVVLELLNIVTDRSGRPDAGERFITRDEVSDLLATSQDRIPTTRWDEELKSRFVSSVLANTEQKPVALDCRPDPLSVQIAGGGHTGPPRPLEEWIEARTVCVLGGPSGTGKSTVLLGMQRRAAQNGAIVLVAEAEGYIPGRLPALVAGALNRHAYIGAHPAVGNAALSDPDVILAIDGVSEIDVGTRENLKQETVQLVGANPRAAIILAGRDTTTTRSVLHRNAATTDLVVMPLDEGQQQMLVDAYFQVGPEASTELVRRANRTLDEVAKNPLMLLLGIYAMLRDGDVANSARIFRTVVRLIADDNGYPDASLYEVGLGMAYSRLLDEGRRYCDSLTWMRILTDVAGELAAQGHNISAAKFRQFGSETGLVRRVQQDSIRPLHDSFADYLAAAALSASMSPLPARLTTQDRARIRYLAGLSGVDHELASLVTRDLPLTAVNVGPLENSSATETWLARTHLYVDNLQPTSVPRPRIAYWQDPIGRRIVTVNGGVDGWWDGPGPDGVNSSGWTFPISAKSGPLQVAIQVWRRYLDEMLTPPALSGMPVPRNITESIQLLAQCSDQLHATLSELISAIGITGVDSAQLAELTETRLQFFVSDADDVSEERDRSVWFRDVAELPDGQNVLIGSEPTDNSWTSWGRVDSFVSQGPAQLATKRIRGVINAAVGRTWL